MNESRKLPRRCVGRYYVRKEEEGNPEEGMEGGGRVATVGRA